MNDLFKVHILTEDGISKAKELADIFDKFYDQIEKLIFDNNVPDSDRLWSSVPDRLWSIVRTRLEEASFYAKKTLAHTHHKKEDK